MSRVAAEAWRKFSRIPEHSPRLLGLARAIAPIEWCASIKINYCNRSLVLHHKRKHLVKVNMITAHALYRVKV